MILKTAWITWEEMKPRIRSLSRSSISPALLICIHDGVVGDNVLAESLSLRVPVHSLHSCETSGQGSVTTVAFCIFSSSSVAASQRNPWCVQSCPKSENIMVALVFSRNEWLPLRIAFLQKAPLKTSPDSPWMLAFAMEVMVVLKAFATAGVL